MKVEELPYRVDQVAENVWHLMGPKDEIIIVGGSADVMFFFVDKLNAAYCKGRLDGQGPD